MAPGVQVVALVPVAGPVPPPSIVVTPDIRASSICCGQMKWICASNPPAVRIFPSPGDGFGPRSDNNVNTGLGVRIARLADPRDLSVLETDIRLDDTPRDR